MYRSLHGFTLVELLVVITIIGILMALIVPGVNAVREQGRQTVCLSNESQMAKAILMYETSKNHLPGVLNQTSEAWGVLQYNWVEAIFPYLERGDMWGTLCKTLTGSTAVATMRLTVTVCPNDPYLVDVTSTNAQALLSYGVNDGFFVSYVPVGNPPVSISDRYGNPQAPAIPSKLTARPNTTFPRGESVSSSATIMLGERTGDGSNTYPRPGNPAYPTTTSPPNYATAGPWATTATSVGSSAAAWNALAFPWPTASAAQTPPAPTPTTISPYIMVSAHPGKVIATFFDGHSDKVNNDTVYPQ